MTKFITYFSLAALVCLPVAGDAQPSSIPSYLLLPHGWFVNIDGGASWPYIHKDMFEHNGDKVVAGLGNDHYTGNSPDNGMLGAMAGYQWIWGCGWFPGISIGARYQHYIPATVSGFIDQFGLILFRNYKYSFQIAADEVGFYSKLYIFYVDKFFFYADGGVGAAFTRTGDYTETALPGVIPRVSPGWGHHNQTNMAYNWGLGMDYMLTQQWTLTVGYDYQYLGRMHTGFGLGIWSDTYLSIGDYEANSIYAGFSFFFDRVRYEK